MLFLDQLLRRPLYVVEAELLRRSRGFAVRRGVFADAPRLLLIQAGTMRYRVEGRSFTVSKGEALFVPARVLREWRSVGGCDLLFFSFDSDPPVHMDAMPMLAKDIDVHLEAAAIERIIAASGAGQKSEAEGEMKAVLARVLTRARPALDSSRPPVEPPFGVRTALLWMESHFAEPDVLDHLHDRAGLSAWYFRKMFKRTTGRRPTEHLLHLRMRAARLHVMESGLSLKEVARRVGFTDPLYFSRCYSRFWGHPPSWFRQAN